MAEQNHKNGRIHQYLLYLIGVIVTIVGWFLLMLSTKVNTGAIVNTLYLNAGKVAIGTDTATFYLDIWGGNANDAMRLSVTAAGSTTLRMDGFNDSASSRNFALRNRYNAQGRLELMKSAAAGGDPTTAIMCWDDALGSATIPGIASASGVRYVCVDTNGTLTSQSAACVGT